MTKDPAVYLLHILDAIGRIERYVADGEEAFLADEKSQDAVARNLEIIGEATKRLPAKLRAEYPAIPWKEIAGMRDVLIHDYLGIDERVVWRTVAKDLPRLRRAVERMLRRRSGKRKASSRR